ncbi:MAG: lysophospholipid acyltransferase family protein [bacterium]
MNQKARKRACKISEILAPEDYRRLRDIEIHDLGFGYDPFGLERESALLAFALLRFLHQYWFRVESHGVENVPEEGPALITPNHSGVIPIDAAMLGVDLAMRMRRPRVMRAVVDNFAGFLPFINTIFYRCGQIVGARSNFEELLKHGEMVAVFPEGHKGTGKPYRDRYKLKPFNVGFVELSLLYKTPIIPTAVIGAEEQYPYMLNLKPLASMLRFPYFPVTPLVAALGPLGMLPLPTKYYIYYGEPFHFYRDHPPETVQDPEAVRQLVEAVRTRVQEMIHRGLRERRGIFGLSLFPFHKLLSAKGDRDLVEVGKQIQEKAGLGGCP